ncbi:MAG: hypothetical protein AAFP15_15545, partial [Bacteroidota bacterium]
MRRVASTPSSRGIWTSMSTTSNTCCSTCMDAGMDGFITKPFSFEQLAAELRLGALGGTTVGRA